MNHEKYKDHTAEYAIAESGRKTEEKTGRETWNQKRGCYSDHTNQLCFW